MKFKYSSPIYIYIYITIINDETKSQKIHKTPCENNIIENKNHLKKFM